MYSKSNRAQNEFTKSDKNGIEYFQKLLAFGIHVTVNQHTALALQRKQNKTKQRKLNNWNQLNSTWIVIAMMFHCTVKHVMGMFNVHAADVWKLH